jgi:hypothetical protein
MKGAAFPLLSGSRRLRRLFSPLVVCQSLVCCVVCVSGCSSLTGEHPHHPYIPPLHIHRLRILWDISHYNIIYTHTISSSSSLSSLHPQRQKQKQQQACYTTSSTNINNHLTSHQENIIISPFTPLSIRLLIFQHHLQITITRPNTTQTGENDTFTEIVQTETTRHKTS